LCYLQNKLANKTLREEERARVRDEREKHLQHILKERMLWHERMEECREATQNQVMAIYLDGMDQKKTDIPWTTNYDFDKRMKVR